MKWSLHVFCFFLCFCLTHNILTFCEVVLKGKVLYYQRTFKQVPSVGSCPCFEDLLRVLRVSSFHPPAPLKKKGEIYFLVVCYLSCKSYNYHLQLRLSSILFVTTCFVREWRRIKKSGSTLIKIGFVIQAKNDHIWPFLNNGVTASEHMRYLSKFPISIREENLRARKDWRKDKFGANKDGAEDG